MLEIELSFPNCRFSFLFCWGFVCLFYVVAVIVAGFGVSVVVFWLSLVCVVFLFVIHTYFGPMTFSLLVLTQDFCQE